jgi:hypothetical protein
MWQRNAAWRVRVGAAQMGQGLIFRTKSLAHHRRKLTASVSHRNPAASVNTRHRAVGQTVRDGGDGFSGSGTPPPVRLTPAPASSPYSKRKWVSRWSQLSRVTDLLWGRVLTFVRTLGRSNRTRAQLKVSAMRGPAMKSRIRASPQGSAGRKILSLPVLRVAAWGEGVMRGNSRTASAMGRRPNSPRQRLLSEHRGGPSLRPKKRQRTSLKEDRQRPLSW